MAALRLRDAFVAVGLLLAGGGCRGCFCTNAAKSIGEKPPEDVVREETKAKLERSPSTLQKLCGIRVAGLRDLVVTILEAHGQQAKVRVEGTAIPHDGGPGE